MVGRPQKYLTVLEPPVRQICAYIVITLFVVFFFSSGLSHQFQEQLPFFQAEEVALPDFRNYIDTRTLSPEQFPIDEPNRRTIIIGDIHGMYRSLDKLLIKLSYNSSSDVLIHVGDILTKGADHGSRETLGFMAAHNIIGVRGNHEQKIIQWYAWSKWIRMQPGGAHWLKKMAIGWARASSDKDIDSNHWLKHEMTKGSDRQWWKKIPDGWKLFEEHFVISQKISREHAEYLNNLPSIIHVPKVHAFIVHGGILPSDPDLAYDNPRQPLAHIPRLPHELPDDKTKMNITWLRTLQERTILTEVPQNTVHHNVLSIRSIIKGKVSENKNGKPWTGFWNHDMLRCAGFNKDVPSAGAAKELLPCYPSTVVYGHSASRGLDVNRWSIGLDTGCVYKRRLSALVLGSGVEKLLERGEEETAQESVSERDGESDVQDQSNPVIQFGESHRGKIVSVSCHCEET